jgi:hypothetical protein
VLIGKRVRGLFGGSTVNNAENKKEEGAVRGCVRAGEALFVSSGVSSDTSPPLLRPAANSQLVPVPGRRERERSSAFPSTDFCVVGVRPHGPLARAVYLNNRFFYLQAVSKAALVSVTAQAYGSKAC